MRKRVLFVLACLWILISFMFIRVTYSKYLSGFDASADVQIDVWSIVLNDQDILDDSDFSSNLSLNFDGDDYRSADCIVPGAIGYFDLEIDTSAVTIPFTYTVTAEAADDNDVDDIEVIGFSVNGNNNTITYLDSTHTEIQNSASAVDNVSSIRVYVKWEDEDSNQMTNDIEDTDLALSSGIVSLDVNVSFDQIIQPSASPTPTATATATAEPTTGP